MTRLLSAAIPLLVLAACAAPASGRHPAPGGASTITRQEIAASAAPDALEMIRTLRPHWIPRGGSPLAVEVYLGGSRLGGLLELRSYRPEELGAVEYLSASQAEFRYPDVSGKPVLVLTLHRERQHRWR